MPESSNQLCAIMFTDIVGYTALMGSDVERGLEMLRINREIHKTAINNHNGQYLKEIGDGTMAKFSSARDSVLCAVEIQKRTEKELGAKLRIGIHLGDVTIENNDVFGDGVNIASRLQSVADPGGIYVSESIYEAIRARKDVDAELLGEIQLKNVDHLVKTYYIKGKGIAVPAKEKIKKLIDQPHNRAIKPLWFIAVAILALAAFLVIKYWVPEVTGYQIRSVAVLPVENISGRESEEWLSAGIHYGLIDELMKIQSLRVVSRTSTLKYGSTNKSIPEIADELDVDGIVEVSYIMDEKDLNIQFRFYQARPEERQLWRNDYNRKLRDVFTMYSDVARTVAQEINITLSEKEKNRLASNKQINPEAYEAYIKGMMHWDKLGKPDLDIAMGYFERAIELDPDFALAYAGKAYVWGGRMQGGYVSSKIAGPKAREAMEKAVALDNTLTEIHYRLAVSNTWYYWNWKKAREEFLKTIDLNPNHANAHAYYAHFLGIMGSPEEGIPHGKKAVELEKLNTRIKALYAMTLRHADSSNEAIKVLEEAYSMSPRELLILSTMRSAYHDEKMYEKAIEAGKQYYAVKLDSINVRVLEQAFKDGGYHYAIQKNAEVLAARSDSTYITPWQVATLYTRAGMKEEALEWLDKAYEEHDVNMPYISADPIFDYLREDPRFRELLKKMELK